MAEKKGFFVRLNDEEISAVSIIANYRGETREKATRAAFKLLAKETFADEIKSGQDFPMQKLPCEIRLSDVLKILGVRG
ncbi:MAG: hypothetical protein A4E56_02253 [Pelotomaculum sp. PtaU1.Bin065]|nr:MAG: hypothetical protein A4E56_02253 [Pelotomaculum sp. PtaU1.Bin065]